MKITNQFPIVITSGYGNRSSGWHGGVDIVGYNGSCNVLDYICAKADGKVIAVRKDCKGYEPGGSYGNYVLIDHGNGVHTLYAHLAYGSITVNVGDYVKGGQIFAYMGNTGTSFGGHCHFEVRINGVKVDPTEYLIDKPLPISIPEAVKTTDCVAQEVIAGNWGNGQERIDRLILSK